MMSGQILRRIVVGAVAAIGLLVALGVTPQSSAAEGVGRGRAIAAQQKHTNALMAREGVVGTAVGLGQDDEHMVKVYVKSARDRRGVPSELDGVPVAVEVTGEIRALGDTTARHRPAPIGVSTGHPQITAGTIGAMVTDGANVYALSNNHVYADENTASIGDNVLQPGAFDGGTDPDDAIGTLHDFEPIAFDGSPNVIDAAIALSSKADLLNSTLPDGYGTPSATTAEAALRLKVIKYGRTTGLTKGRVDAINATVDVGYDSGVARFVGQIVIKPGRFSAGGDSGSLIVTQSGNQPVGLLFAGSSFVTIANPIGPVLERFGVSIDDAEGSGSVTGTLTDSTTDSPIAGGSVSADTGQSDTTDVNGEYTLSDVPAGDRTVTAAATGYVSQQKSATVTDGAATVVDFALVPESSGGTGSVKGKVTDAQGAKLGGVLIETDTGQSATTNRGGRYNMDGVPEGSRTVTASKTGYVTQAKQVDVASGVGSTANFALLAE